MNLLQVFFIISAVIILILALDIARKQKFNALHFLVFFWVGAWLLVFTFFPFVLDNIWKLFWIPRWADVLVYVSIIFLIYFVLLLLAKVEKNASNTTSLIREIAIENSNKKILTQEIWFLIRVYNEQKVLKSTIEKIIKAWYTDIVVVNDWSLDNSLKILKDFDNIILLNHIQNRWWWAALETWFEYFRRYWKNRYVCTFDADWQHQIKDLDNFIKAFEENKNLKIVLWSRFIKNKNSNIRLSRKIILKLWILFTFFVSYIKLTDAHNWYRLLKKEVLDKIKITIDDMWYASEFIDQIASKKIPFKEVPVDIIYTKYSMSKWQKSINAINIAFKFIWSKFFK